MLRELFLCSIFFFFFFTMFHFTYYVGDLEKTPHTYLLFCVNSHLRHTRLRATERGSVDAGGCSFLGQQSVERWRPR